MAIQPGKLTPSPVLRQPDTEEQMYGNIVNPPTIPNFGGAKAVQGMVQRAPYGKIVHAGRRGVTPRAR